MRVVEGFGSSALPLLEETRTKSIGCENSLLLVGEYIGALLGSVE
jgi:hypothetical protein